MGINDFNGLGEVRILFGVFFVVGLGEFGLLFRISFDRFRVSFKF